MGTVAVTGNNRRGYARRRSADAAVVVPEPEPSPSETTSQPWNPLQPNMTGPDGTVTLRTIGRHPRSPAPCHRRRGCDAWPGGDFRLYCARGVWSTLKVSRRECDEYQGDPRAQGGCHGGSGCTSPGPWPVSSARSSALRCMTRATRSPPPRSTPDAFVTGALLVCSSWACRSRSSRSCSSKVLRRVDRGAGDRVPDHARSGRDASAMSWSRSAG